MVTTIISVYIMDSVHNRFIVDVFNMQACACTIHCNSFSKCVILTRDLITCIRELVFPRFTCMLSQTRTNGPTSFRNCMVLICLSMTSTVTGVQKDYTIVL